jgi:hypothetical protein
MRAFVHHRKEVVGDDGRRRQDERKEDMSRKRIPRDAFIQLFGAKWVLDMFEAGTTEPTLQFNKLRVCGRTFDTRQAALDWTANQVRGKWNQVNCWAEDADTGKLVPVDLRLVYLVNQLPAGATP